MKKILISGYYGFGNIGDEAILQSMIEELNKMNQEVTLTVLSQNPEETMSHFDVNAVNRSSIFKVINSVRKNDVLISGGGSLLQESTSRLSIYYYLFIYFVAMIFRKKIVVFSHGIGPIHRRFSKWLIKIIFNRVFSISVRDIESKNELLSYGVHQDKIDVTADPVISFSKFGHKKGLDIFKRYGHFDENVKTIGFALKSSKTTCVIDDFVSIIDDLKENPCNIVMFPFHYSEDKVLIHELCERSNHEIICIEDKHSVDEMFSMIEALDVLVGVRLHALIFAAVSGTPVVGISYDPKIDAFLNSIGESSVCKIDGINPPLILENIFECIENRTQKSKTLDKEINVYKNKLRTYNSNINAMLDVR